MPHNMTPAEAQTRIENLIAKLRETVIDLAEQTAAKVEATARDHTTEKADIDGFRDHLADGISDCFHAITYRLDCIVDAEGVAEMERDLDSLRADYYAAVL